MESKRRGPDDKRADLSMRVMRASQATSRALSNRDPKDVAAALYEAADAIHELADAFLEEHLAQKRLKAMEAGEERQPPRLTQESVS